MNDIATIERALKDADRVIETFSSGDIAGVTNAEVIAVREQITQALMILRRLPSLHGPGADLEAALRHYAELGPAKMERRDLDLIRDAARGEIADLRDALAKAEAERDRVCELGERRTRERDAAMTKAEALEADRDSFSEMLTAYQKDWEDAESRASALEALLAECETIIDALANYGSAHAKFSDVDHARSLLTKLKGRA